MISAPPFQIPSITWTGDQRTALEKLKVFLSQPDAGIVDANKLLESNLFLLGGYAGTGKTTIISMVIQAALATGQRVAFSAPTHKAVDVAKAIGRSNGIGSRVTFNTIHSLLGLTLYESDRKGLQQTGASQIGNYNLICIDEGSMSDSPLVIAVNEALVRTLSMGLLSAPPKIIWMGDPAQLPPPEERRISRCFDIGKKSGHRAILKQVVRQGEGSPLMEEITRARQFVVSSKQPYKAYRPRNCHDKKMREGMILTRREDFIQVCQKRFTQTWVHEDPNSFRVLCATNAVVDYINGIAREAIYGQAMPPLIVGERMIARGSIYTPDRKRVLIQKSTEFTVLKVREVEYGGYDAYEVVGRLDDGMEFLFFQVQESDRARFEADVEAKLRIAKKCGAWRDYYDLRDKVFPSVRPCYALTVHNSQGSTYGEVGIVSKDLIGWAQRAQDDWDLRVYNSLWYVAASRARTRAFVAA